MAQRAHEGAVARREANIAAAGRICGPSGEPTGLTILQAAERAAKAQNAINELIDGQSALERPDPKIVFRRMPWSRSRRLGNELGQLALGIASLLGVRSVLDSHLISNSLAAASDQRSVGKYAAKAFSVIREFEEKIVPSSSATPVGRESDNVFGLEATAVTAVSLAGFVAFRAASKHNQLAHGMRPQLEDLRNAMTTLTKLLEPFVGDKATERANALVDDVAADLASYGNELSFTKTTIGELKAQIRQAAIEQPDIRSVDRDLS